MTEKQADLLNGFSDVIETVRTKLVKIVVKENNDFSYALIRVFSRMALNMCEIFTLLNNGYPEGAFVLSRQVYEALVIMDYLSNHTETMKAYLNDSYDSIAEYADGSKRADNPLPITFRWSWIYYQKRYITI